MPSHQERIQNKNPEMNCNHIWLFKKQSNIAPFINKNGSRTTIKICFNCGLIKKFIRSQKEYEDELKNRNIFQEEILRVFNK